MMSSIRWCSSCMRKRIASTTDLGFTCCNICGKVLSDDLFIEEAQFGKNADWQNLVDVFFVNAVASEDSVSHKKTLNRGLENLTLIEDLHSNSGDGGPGTSRNTSDPPERL